MTTAIFVLSLLLLHVALLGAGYCVGRMYAAARSPEVGATRVDSPGATRAASTYCAALASQDGTMPVWIELDGAIVHVPTFANSRTAGPY